MEKVFAVSEANGFFGGRGVGVKQFRTNAMKLLVMRQTSVSNMSETLLFFAEPARYFSAFIFWTDPDPMSELSNKYILRVVQPAGAQASPVRTAPQFHRFGVQNLRVPLLHLPFLVIKLAQMVGAGEREVGR